MTQKFKVGDKVRILTVDGIYLASYHDYVNGDITDVIEVADKGQPFITAKHGGKIIEKVSKKNERISALEAQVAELTAKFEALENEQKPAVTLGEKPETYWKGEYVGGLSDLDKSPNEQRKAIIAEAKAFVERYSGIVPDDSTPYTTEAGDTIVKLFVNKEKRIVTAIPHLVHVECDEVDDKKFAKCAPDDVFNADIGKAIALGRALGLDVKRFEQAVKPTEVVVGMVVRTKYEYGGYNDDCPTKVTGVTAKGYPEFKNGTHSSMYEIKDDTDAQY